MSSFLGVLTFCAVFGALEGAASDPWNPCASYKKCPKGQVCVNTDVVCITSPCYPVPECQPECGKNEQFYGCGACDQICGEEPTFCTLVCRIPGECGCKPDYCRNKDKKCVSTCKV